MGKKKVILYPVIMDTQKYKSDRAMRIFNIILLVFILLLAGCLKKNPYGSGGGLSWQEIESPTTRNLNSVFALSEYNAWAVGDTGVIVHWNGSKWNLVASPTTSKLNGLYFVDNSDGWIVGDSGVILHWNGTGWFYDSSPVNEDLNGVYFLNKSDGWAVGDSGVILHYDGQGWMLNFQSNVRFLRSLHFLSSTEGWVVGNKILRYYAGTWATFDAAVEGGILYSVCFIDNNYGWAVGDWGIGERGGKGPLILHYNGSEWQYVDTSFPTGCVLFSVFFIERQEGWIGGSQYTGGLIHYLKGKWSLVNILDNKAIFSLYLIETIDIKKGWAVGTDGYILKYGN